MGVTVDDIARACGVSRGTVDRALNNKPRISKETKEKILEVSEKMGYRPDLLARSLVKGRSMSIGVVVFDIQNRFFAQLLNSIVNEAKRKNYFVNITIQEEDPDLELQLINRLVDRRNDGIIICPVNKGQAFIEFLKDLPIPVIVIGNEISDEISYIGIDDYKAARDATDLIVSKNYNQIVFVCPPLENKDKENIYSHEQRLAGFLDVMNENKSIGYAVIDHSNYIADIKNYLQQDKKTAFFCSGDTFALDILKHFRKIGKKVPENIGIMGFDGIDTLEHVTPSLATVFYPVEKIGTMAISNLIDLMNGKDIDKHIVIPHEIILGESL